MKIIQIKKSNLIIQEKNQMIKMLKKKTQKQFKEIQMMKMMKIMMILEKIIEWKIQI